MINNDSKTTTLPWIHENHDEHPSSQIHRKMVTSLELPVDMRHDNSTNVETHRITSIINKAQAIALRKLAIFCETTIDVILLSIFRASLYCATGEEDGLIGLAHYSDTPSKTTGPLTMLSLDIGIDQQNSFEDLILNSKRVTDEAFCEAENSPDISSALPDAFSGFGDLQHSTPRTIFVIGDGSPDSGSSEYHEYLQGVLSMVDLSIHFISQQNGPGLLSHIQYNSNLFLERTIKTFAKTLERVIKVTIQNPTLKISTLILTSLDDLSKIMCWNDTIQPSGDNRPIGDRLCEVASKHSLELAVCDQSLSLTYGELDDQSDRLASWLCAKKMPSEAIVGVWMGRSTLLVVAYLACLKAGLAYMPLEKAIPLERLQLMVQTADCHLVLSSRTCPLIGFVNCIDLAVQTEVLNSYPKGQLPIVTEQQIGNVLFTSGSTGVPKGVMIEHHSLVNLCAPKTCYWQGKLQSGLTAGITFDPSGYQISAALLGGSPLYVLPDNGIFYANGYRQFIIEHDFQKLSRVSIGRPFLNTSIWVVDEVLNLVPPGVLGRIVLSNTQLKLRSQRIEAGEIESVLNQHPDVDWSAAIVVKSEQDEQLVAYVQLNSGDVVNHMESQITTLESVKQHLHQKLPKFMESWIATSYPLLSFWHIIHGIRLPEVILLFTCGHSMMAMRIMSCIRQCFGVALDMITFINNATVKAVTLQLSRHDRDIKDNGHDIPRIDDSVMILPVSDAQAHLWVEEQMNLGLSRYNASFQRKIKGTLDVEILERSFMELIERHEVLCTTFHMHNAVLMQSVETTYPYPIRITMVADGEYEQKAQRILAEESVQPFNLSKEIPTRLAVVHAPGHDVFYVSVTIHHIATDGWSACIIDHELLVMYDSLANGIPPTLEAQPLRYQDYSTWQNFEHQLQYWSSQLRGATPLELPTDFIRPEKLSGQAGEVEFNIAKSTVTALHQLAVCHQTSLYVVLLAAFCEEDRVLGVVNANQTHPELEGLVGFFVNTHGIRLPVDKQTSYDDLILTAKQVSAEALQHAEIPFDRDFAHVGGGEQMQSFGHSNWATEDLRIASTQVDLTIHLFVQHGGLCSYTMYQNNINRIALWNDFEVELSLPNASIGYRFHQVALKENVRLAVVDQSISLTYLELNDQSDRLATWLWMGRLALLVVAYLGCLKAGLAYIPLKWKLPTKHLQVMVQSADCQLVLSIGECPLSEFVECVDLAKQTEITQTTQKVILPAVKDSQLSNVIFTRFQILTMLLGGSELYILQDNGIFDTDEYCQFIISNAKDFAYGHNIPITLQTIGLQRLSMTPSVLSPLLENGSDWLKKRCALPNTKLYIVDKSLYPVPPGVIGEIIPQITVEHFLNLPEDHPVGSHVYLVGDLGYWTDDSLIQFVGWKDTQFKLIAYIKLTSNPPANSKSEEGVLAWWEEHYNKEGSFGVLSDDIMGHDFACWNSMFTGRAILTDEMVNWLQDSLRSIAPKTDDTVLEIGVGTRQIALNLIDHVKSYFRTDLSALALRYLGRQAKLRGLENKLKVAQAAAHEFGDVPDTRFSLAIINSVVQYFPSANYLTRVIDEILQHMISGGCIFFGDIRSYALICYHDLEHALATADKTMTPEDIQQSLKDYASSQAELLLSPRFFFGLKKCFSSIAHVKIKPKVMNMRNELSQYRYLVILHVSQPPTLTTPPVWLDFSMLNCTVQNLGSMLHLDEHQVVGITKIPSLDLQPVDRAVCLLDGDGKLEVTVPFLLVQLEEDANSGSSTPMILSQVAQEAGWCLTMDYSIQGRSADSLKEQLHQILPEFMVPNQIIVIEHLPMNHSGKLDHRLLSIKSFLNACEPSTNLQKCEGLLLFWYLSPSNETECAVMAIFSKVLDRAVNLIDPEESLFNLGGHSLMAMNELPALEALSNNIVLSTDDHINPMLFFFPKMTGYASVYALAFDTIPNKVVAFRDKGWGQPLTTRNPALIASMARSYVRQILEFQPKGPFHLVGWSFSGYLAFETAMQLEALGKSVAMVLMVDTSIYNAQLQTSGWGAELDHLLSVVDNRSAWLTQLRWVDEMILNYNVQADGYKGKAVLIKALQKCLEGEQALPEDLHNGWLQYLPQIDVLGFDMTHQRMFDRENGPLMGRLISQIIDDTLTVNH
ncbi:acetyl-CoA synthetase-like protein [Ramaria rubella]|nr:acetyl-CoA synthetase-like protein [Ramaria rubella]